MRGVRVVTNVERNAVDANVPIDERHDLRTAKSCGPGAPMQAPSRPRCLEHRADDGGNKLVHRGEYEVSRKPLRREGRTAPAEPVGQRALLRNFSARWPWVQPAPGLPHRR